MLTLILKVVGFLISIKHREWWCPLLCKRWSRKPRRLKLGGLIACIMFCIRNMLIWNSEIKTCHNDVIKKTITKVGPSRNHRSKGFDKSSPKNVLFIEFEPLCQKLWLFFVNFGMFTMSFYQIWSCHVPQAVNFKKFWLWTSSAFNFRNSYDKKSLLLQRLSTKSLKGRGMRWKYPSVLLGLKPYSWVYRPKTAHQKLLIISTTRSTHSTFLRGVQFSLAY